MSNSRIEPRHRRKNTAVRAADNEAGAAGGINREPVKIVEATRRAARAERNGTEKAEARSPMRIVSLRFRLAANIEINRELELRCRSDIEIDSDARISAEARLVRLHICFVGRATSE